MSITVFADNEAKTGSIKVIMKYNDSTVSGGSLTLYKVGNAEKESAGYKYTLTEDFAGSGAALAAEESADAAKTLASYASNNGIKGTTLTIDSYGKAKFKDLEIGVYLIVQNTAASGYENITPFLVNMPTLLSGSGYAVNADNEIYDVEATPKLSKVTSTPSATPKAASTPTRTTGSSNSNRSVNIIASMPSPNPSTVTSVDTPKSTDNPSSPDGIEPDNPQTAENGNTPEETTLQNDETPSNENKQQDVVITPNTSDDEETEQTKLPQTGQLNWPIPVLVIFGLTVFSIGWNLRFGKIRRR